MSSKVKSSEYFFSIVSSFLEQVLNSFIKEQLKDIDKAKTKHTFLWILHKKCFCKSGINSHKYRDSRILNSPKRKGKHKIHSSFRASKDKSSFLLTPPSPPRKFIQSIQKFYLRFLPFHWKVSQPMPKTKEIKYE